MTPHPRVHQILVLKFDNFAAESLSEYAHASYPDAHCTRARRIAEANAILSTNPIDLLLTGIGLPDGDALDLLARCATDPGRPRRTLVVTRAQPLRVLASLAGLRVNGVFDSDAEAAGRISAALRQIEQGQYWSSSCLAKLADARGRMLLRQLSPTEQLVLAIIGRGCTDIQAGAELGMKPCSIQTVRRELHAKLRVHEKGDLIKEAGRLGFVRFATDTVQSLGLGLLLREYRANAKRPVAVPEKLISVYREMAAV